MFGKFLKKGTDKHKKAAAAAKPSAGQSEKASVSKPKATSTPKPAAKKAGTAKVAPKKPVAKKTAAAKKPTASKKATTSKKAPAKTATKKPATAKKPTVKKTATKKPAAKKATTAAKPATKKTSAQSAPKKAAAPKKTVASKKAAAPKQVAAPKPVAKKQAAASTRPTRIKKARGKASSSLLFGQIKPYQPTKTEEYMNEKQRNHFQQLLEVWRSSLLQEADRTVTHLKDEIVNLPDPNDRASQEEEFALELRTRDRERKLLKKIDKSLHLIMQDDYGFCDVCGEEIGIRRLEARPTANMCIDCKELQEIKEKQLIG